MAQPSRDEIIAYIQELSAKYGIDPKVFEAVINGELGLNPNAVGDKGQSFGLAQLYMGGGLGNTYEQQYGARPDQDKDWRRQLEFTAQQAVGGGKGWEPWHASARLGIDPRAGLPGGPTTTAGATPANRGRGGQAMPPSRVAVGQPQPEEDPGLLEAFREFNKPKATLGGWALRKAGLIPEDSTSKTLGEAVLKGVGIGDPEKDAAAKASVEGYNSAAPLGRAEQIAQLEARKKKQLGPALVGLFGGTQPQGATVGSAAAGGLSNFFKGLFG